MHRTNVTPDTKVVIDLRTQYVKATVTKVTKTQVKVVDEQGREWTFMLRSGIEFGKADRRYPTCLAEVYSGGRGHLMTWEEADDRLAAAARERKAQQLARQIVNADSRKLARLPIGTLEQVISLLELED